MLTDLYKFTFYFSITLLVIVLLKVLIFLSLSSRHHNRFKKYHPHLLIRSPRVSVVVPCFNEELTVANCVKSLLQQTYSNFDIVLVDDGSKDKTLPIIEELARKYEKVHSYSKLNGGKASALNYGIAQADGSIVICMDADSMFLPKTLTQLVLSFQEPGVAAVGGNVRVANRSKAMGRHQAIEYITGLTVQRRAFAHLGCMQVISGAIGAFRKDVLTEIGGYSTDTIVEDMDITIELAKRGKKVTYNPHAIAYTEAPENISDFLKQRYRWTYGGLQVIAKHKDMIFKRKLNKMGTIGIPYFIIFPWVDVLVSCLLVYSLLRVLFTGNGISLLVFYLVMASIQAALMMYALIIDEENKKLALMAGLDSLFYSHLISFTTLRAGVNYLLKKKPHWNKLQRYGKNNLY